MFASPLRMYRVVGAATPTTLPASGPHQQSRTRARPLPPAPRREQGGRRGGAARAPPSSRRSGGMYARTNTVLADPKAIDEGIANVRDEVMPLVQGMDGFIGLSMLADRNSGRCIVTTAWRTEEAMHASEQG